MRCSRLFLELITALATKPLAGSLYIGGDEFRNSIPAPSSLCRACLPRKCRATPANFHGSILAPAACAQQRLAALDSSISGLYDAQAFVLPPHIVSSC
jgi:hypothetical protein